MALTGAPDHLALDSSGKAAVEKGESRTPSSHARSHAHTLAHTHSGTVASEPARLGIQMKFCFRPPPALQRRPPRASLPLAPDSLSGIYKHFLQINICIDYSLWVSRVSLVIQLAEVAAKACCRGKKNNRRREGPSSCWVWGCQQHRKEEKKRKALENEGVDKGRRERGSNSKKNAAMAGRMVPGILVAWREAPCWVCCSVHRFADSALGVRSDSQSWYLLRKSFGGDSLACWQGKEESSSSEVKHDCFPQPCGGYAVAWFVWNSLQLSDGTRRENN